VTTPNGKLLQGTLDLLVLKTLAWGPRHGYAIARWLEDATDNALRIEEGSLYPALYRLEERGWLKGRWVEKPGQRRRRFYALTAEGRGVLEQQRETWQKFVNAIASITETQHA